MVVLVRAADDGGRGAGGAARADLLDSGTGWLPHSGRPGQSPP
jgi:hypothetical protein